MRVLIILFLISLPAIAVADCDASKAIEFDLETDGVRRLSLDVGAGDLTVVGAPDAGTVQVRGRACAGSRDDLEDMELRHERRDDELVVTSEIDSGSNWIFFSFDWNDEPRYIDIEVTVPEGLMLDIEDGSGPLNIRDLVGNLRIDDGSGGMAVNDVDGDVVIDDGSGTIDVHRVTGRVEVKDGSGSILIGDTGPVRVDDGSGDIRIRGIEGDVLIVDDGSGPIDIESVRGHVTIEDDGSGDIDVRDVTGDFLARDTGSGDVRYNAIGGEVQVRD